MVTPRLLHAYVHSQAVAVEQARRTAASTLYVQDMHCQRWWCHVAPPPQRALARLASDMAGKLHVMTRCNAMLT
jgi:hypothetical protein